MATEEDVHEEIIDLDEIKKMKVADLRAKLTEFGLSSKGTKQQLVARLEEFYSGQDDEVGDDGLLDDEEDGQVEEEAEDGSFEHDTGKAGESGKAEQQKQQDGENASGNTVGAASVKSLTDAERKALRAEKFGVVSMDAKKQARAERFGLSTDSADAPFSKKPKVDEQTLEKLKKRADRFGESVSSAIKKVEDDDKKLQRAKRFGEPVLDEKMKKRAERFGMS